jgi:hypothetical protein
MFPRFRSSIEKENERIEKKRWRLWREPLIHFFILGLAVFGLNGFLEREPEVIVDDPYLVEVSSADIEWMRTLFNKRMGREPTVQDLRGHVHQLIREQILSREAIAMGLDEGDIVVRRRLAQKMEFLFKDISEMVEPTEEDLRSYYIENRQKYTIPPRITFTQIYFSVENKGAERANQAIEKLINEKINPDSAAERGDPSLLSSGCIDCSEREIKNRYGEEFTEGIINLETGSWKGPVKSTYGFHAVYVHNRQEAILPAFPEVSDQIKTDWIASQREENTRKVYGEIRSRYQVLVEGLPYDIDLKG